MQQQYAILKPGDRLNFEITGAMLKSIVGDEAHARLSQELEGDGSKLRFATASDTGNCIRVEHDDLSLLYLGRLVAIGPGYAAVTTIVSKPDGKVVAVLGAQFYVLGEMQDGPAVGQLAILELQDVLTRTSAAVAADEAAKQTGVETTEQATGTTERPAGDQVTEGEAVDLGTLNVGKHPASTATSEEDSSKATGSAKQRRGGHVGSMPE